MWQKLIKVVLAFSLLGIVWAMVTYFLGDRGWYTLFERFSNLFLLSALFFLLITGSYIRTNLFYWSFVGAASVVVGTNFKIMHWPGASDAIGAGFLWMFVLYAIHFARKGHKRWVDYGKMAFGFLFLLGEYCILAHLPYGRQMVFVAIMLLLVVTVEKMREPHAL